MLSILKKDKPAFGSRTSELGALGERLAADHLIRSGMRIVMTNFKIPVGRNSRGAVRTGEIDIIALDADTIVFVEVKTRRSDDFAPAEQNVDRRKQRQIARTARVYRRVFNLEASQFRYDVISVMLPELEAPTITHHRAFWSDTDLVYGRQNGR